MEFSIINLPIPLMYFPPPIARLDQECWTDRLSSRQERKTDKLVVDARKAI